MPRQPEGESPAPPTQRPMLRSVAETQLTFTNFPYHEIVVCCQYGLCFGQMREFWCMATQTALHLSGPLYPTTIVPLFVRKVWRDITGVPVRHEKSLFVSMNSEWGRGGGMYETNIREAERVAINQSRGIRGGTLSFHIFLSTPLPALMILKQRLYSDLTGFPTTLFLPQPHGIMSP